MLLLVSVAMLIGTCCGQNVSNLFREWKQSLAHEIKSVLIKPHYSVSLDCASSVAGRRLLRAAMFRETRVAWLNDHYNEVISGADGRSVIYDVGNLRRSQLWIGRVTEADAGLYSCNFDKGARFSATPKRRYRTLTMFLVQTSAANAPEYIVYAGNSFSVSCPLEPVYEVLHFAGVSMDRWSVEWRLQNRSVQVGQLSNGTATRMQLHRLDPVGSGHAGLWRCLVQHWQPGERGGRHTRMFLLRRFRLKPFQCQVLPYPGWWTRTPAEDILRTVAPLLGLVLAAVLSIHVVLAVLLFSNLAQLEARLVRWQIVHRFSKKVFMNIYLDEITEDSTAVNRDVSAASVAIPDPAADLRMSVASNETM